MSGREFRPGDVFSRPWGDGRLRFRVEDPVRTGRGKVRYRRLDDDGNPTGGVQTSWWETTDDLTSTYRTEGTAYEMETRP